MIGWSKRADDTENDGIVAGWLPEFSKVWRCFAKFGERHGKEFLRFGMLRQRGELDREVYETGERTQISAQGFLFYQQFAENVSAIDRMAHPVAFC